MKRPWRSEEMGEGEGAGEEGAEEVQQPAALPFVAFAR